jgi:hypothetical protein
MLALREKCIHPTTKKTYVKSSVGGKDNSPEGHQASRPLLLLSMHMPKVANQNAKGGFSHGFVVEFENEEDREYYLNKDPEHLAFVDYVKELVQNIRVVDFEPGKF